MSKKMSRLETVPEGKDIQLSIIHDYVEIDDADLYVEAEKKPLRFQHLFQEKLFYLSPKCQQSLSIGFKPTKNCHFKFCVRLDDHRYCTQILLTLYQYVKLMKDVRKLILTPEQMQCFDRVDANIQFRFKDMDVATVILEAYSPSNIQTSYRLFLPNEEGDSSEEIIVQEKTLRKMIEWENEILNTIRPLEDKTCNHLLKVFIDKCAEQLKEKNIKYEPKYIYPSVKILSKTPFQSEVFLKFWPLVCKEILNKLSQISKTEVSL